MRRLFLVAVLVALPSVNDRGLNSASAADAPAAAKLVTPFLDDQTFAVARLDLTLIDIDPVVERIAKTAGIDPKEIAGPRRAFGEGLALFRRAGATEIYAVLSAADMTAGPFLLVPRAGANDEGLKAALGQVGMGNAKTIEVLDGVMFAGPKPTLQRLRQSKPAARPDLEPALGAVAGAAVQVVLVPSADQRRVVGDLMPMLPKEAGGGPGTILTKGVRWAALGVETKPKLTVKVVVKSDDAAAAEALAGALNKGLDALKQDKGTRQAVPALDDLIAAVRPKVDGDRIRISLDESAPGLVAEIGTGVGKMRAAADRTKSANNLKQMALAWHNYHDRYKAFPDDIKSKDGKPLLSWRVAILPYLEQDNLYKQFHLDEPWDSEHNKALLDKLPMVYRSPAQKAGGGKTTYLAPTGMIGKAHVGVLGARFPDITDGTSNTFLVVETNDAAAAEWTKPADLTVDPKDPSKGLFGHYDQGTMAAFADGSVIFIAKTAAAANLLGMFTRDGGEVIER